MTASRWFKPLCLLAISLQLLMTAISSQGLIRCFEVDGSTHIESPAERQACTDGNRPHAGEQPGPPVLSALMAECVDVPIASFTSADAQRVRLTVAFLAVVLAFLAMPRVWQALLRMLSTVVRSRWVPTDERRPATALDSLGSVVLVL